MDKEWTGPLERLDDYRWAIPKTYKKGMRAPGLIYTNESMVKSIVKDHAPEQVANVAHLPGIIGPSMAMPDIHWGYGFPIGGVAAFDAEEGVVSPGGVGFDINCGVRLIRTNLAREEITPKLRELVEVLFVNVPSGVGSKAKVRLTPQELHDVLKDGAHWAVEHGYGWDADLAHTEHEGRLTSARPEWVSERARERGKVQVGSLGAGNHFCEIQAAADIFRPETAKAFGITKRDQVCIMIHTGSRGCGHQICSDFLESMERAQKKYGIELPDRQLACAPAKSREAEEYFGAMWAGQNFAWANRQMITHWVRQSFEKVLGNSPESMDMQIVYDVAHNVAKREFHEVDGKRRELIVHRKGATRAFPAGNPDIPSDYRDAGQPVLIPGDMGTESYLLVGTERAMKETWGSTCHGAGRNLSRAAATRNFRGQAVIRDLEKRGIIVKPASFEVAAEEAPGAYKAVREVVDVCEGAGISQKVVRLVPMGCVKG